MEITSLPGPDRTISDEDIQNRRMISRRYRNRRIGDFLKELKLVEGRNTGIPTILRAMKKNGSQLPIFETDTDRTYFTVILPVHEIFLYPEAPEVKTPVKHKKRKSIEEIKALILKTLDRIGNVPTSELAAAMDYTKVNDAELISAVHSSMYHQCQRRGYAAPVDVLKDMGVLPKKKYEDWWLGKSDGIAISQGKGGYLFPDNPLSVFPYSNYHKPAYDCKNFLLPAVHVIP